MEQNLSYQVTGYLFTENVDKLKFSIKLFTFFVLDMS